MSIQTEITRITTLRNKIKTALMNWGIVTGTAKLSECTTAIENVSVYKSISAQVQEGQTYNIPAGYHDGSGTVAGVSGGGSYDLQSKTVTPTKSTQAITPDTGYYGLDSVTVNAIPDAYQDVSSVTAQASHVLSPYVFVTEQGVVAGTMINRGTLAATIDGLETTSYTLAAGYWAGGTITLTNAIENALAEI